MSFLRRAVRAGSLAATLAVSPFLMGFPAEAKNDPLTAEEIVKVLPGEWELDPSETSEDQRGDDRCGGRSTEVIRITPTEKGLLYESQRGHAPDEPGVHSDILTTSNAILLRYEGEKRLTPAGEPVQWLLFMPDKDHFFWMRVDWIENGGRTAMRRRCAIAPIS
jgi:hypothetical protein